MAHGRFIWHVRLLRETGSALEYILETTEYTYSPLCFLAQSEILAGHITEHRGTLFVMSECRLCDSGTAGQNRFR